MSNDAPDATATVDNGINNPATNTAADHDDAPDTVAELARWKQIARKHEDRAKANADAAKELEKLRAASMTDLERAIAETKSQTRAEVLRELGETRAADHLRLAATGRPIDIDALLEGVDLKRFVDPDGQPDTKSIQAYIDRIAPQADDPEPRIPRVETGPRGSQNTPLNGDPLLRDLEKKLGIR